MQCFEISTSSPAVPTVFTTEIVQIKNTFISIPNKAERSPFRHTVGCLDSLWSANEISLEIIYSSGSESTCDSRQSSSLGSDTSCHSCDPQNCRHACGPAKGNHLHASGNCRPCVFLTRKAGCANGSDCDFCHEHHTKEFIKEKKRLNKVKSQTKEHRNQRWEKGCFVNANASKSC